MCKKRIKIQNAISEILNVIPKGRIFDSHYVISQLIKYHSDVYLTFASDINASSASTFAVHGQIGKEIAKFEPDPISRIANMSWSENIHGNSSECMAWKVNVRPGKRYKAYFSLIKKGED